MPRSPARLVLAPVLALALLCVACGGGGSSKVRHDGVEAFPDVLEIARAELGDDAAVLAVTFSESTISFDHVQFGRNTRITYNPQGVFTGSKRLKQPAHPSAAFSIAEVPTGAPQRLLAAIQERDGDGIDSLTGTLARDSKGVLVWRASAIVDGSKRDYTASPDGTLSG